MSLFGDTPEYIQSYRSGRSGVPPQEYANGPIDPNYYWLTLPDGSMTRAPNDLSVEDALGKARQEYPDAFLGIQQAMGEDSSPVDAFWATANRSARGLLPGLRMALASATGDEEAYDAAAKELSEITEAASKIAPSLVSTDDIVNTWKNEGAIASVGKFFEFGAEQIGSSFGFQAPSAIASLGGYGIGALALGLGPVGAASLATLAGLGTMFSTFLSSDLERAYTEGKMTDTKDLSLLRAVYAAGGQTALNSLSYMLMGGGAAMRGIAGAGLSTEGKKIAQGAFAKSVERLNRMHPVKQAGAILLEEEVAEVAQQALERSAAGLAVSPANQEALDEYIEVMFATLAPGAGFGVGKMGMSHLSKRAEMAGEQQYLDWKKEVSGVAKASAERERLQGSENFQRLTKAIDDETKEELKKIRAEESEAQGVYREELQKAKAELKAKVATGRASRKEIAAHEKKVRDIQKRMDADLDRRVAERRQGVEGDVDRLASVSARDIHSAASSRNIQWNDSPGFMVWMSTLTGPDGKPIGKFTIDSLNEGERRSVYDVITKIPIQEETTSFAGATNAEVEDIVVDVLESNRGNEITLASIRRVLGLGNATKMNPVAENYADRMAEMGYLSKRDGKYFRNDKLNSAMEEQYAKVVPLIEEYGELPPANIISERTGITDPLVLEDLRVAAITKGDSKGVSEATKRKKLDKFRVEADGEVQEGRYSTPEEADEAANRVLAADTRTHEDIALERRLRVPDRGVRVVEEAADPDVVVNREFQQPKLGKLYEVVDSGRRLGLRTNRKAAQNLARGASETKFDVFVAGSKIGNARKQSQARQLGNKWVDEQAVKVGNEARDASYNQRREFYSTRGQGVPEKEIEAMARNDGKRVAKAFRDENKVTTEKVIAPTPDVVELEGYVVREDTLSSKGEVEESKPVGVFDSEADARQFISDTEKSRRGRQPSRAAQRARTDREAEVERRLEAAGPVPPAAFPFVGVVDEGVIPTPSQEGIPELEMTSDQRGEREKEVAAERTLERTGRARVGGEWMGPAIPQTEEFARQRAEETVLGRLTELGRQLQDDKLAGLTSEEGKKFAREATAGALSPEALASIREDSSKPLWVKNLEAVSRGVLEKIGVPVNIKLYQAREGQESGAEFLTESMVIQIALRPGMESKSFAEQYAAIEPYLNHEVIHVARQLGVIKASEWNKLTEFAESTQYPEADLAAINAARREAGVPQIAPGSTYKQVARVLYAGESIHKREQDRAKAALDRGEITTERHKRIIDRIKQQNWIDDDFNEEAVATAFQHYIRDLRVNAPAARAAPQVEKSVLKKITGYFGEMGRRLRNKGVKTPQDIFESFRGENAFTERIERGKALDSWYSRRTNSAEFMALQRSARERGLVGARPQSPDPMIEAQAVAEGNPVRADDGTPEFADQWLHNDRKTSPIIRRAMIMDLMIRTVDPDDSVGISDYDVGVAILGKVGITKKDLSAFRRVPTAQEYARFLEALDVGILTAFVDPATDTVVSEGRYRELHDDHRERLENDGVDTSGLEEAVVLPNGEHFPRTAIDMPISMVFDDLAGRLSSAGTVPPRLSLEGYVSTLTPEQQADVDLIGTPLPGEVQLDGAFHSALGRALRTSKQRLMELPQLLKMFEKAGVKQEELSWSGFSEAFAKAPPGFKFSIDKMAKNFNSSTSRMDEKGEMVWSGFFSPDLFITEKSQGDVRWGRNYTAENLVQPGGTDYRETLIRLGNSLYDYSSHHWDETNVLVHIRWKTIEGDDGSRTLYIEEIQDDWAKTARKTGYADEEYLDRVYEYRDLNDKHNKTIEEVLKIWHDNPDYVGDAIDLPSEFMGASGANFETFFGHGFPWSKIEALIDLKKQYDEEASKLKSFDEDVTWAALGGGLGVRSRPPDRPFKKTGHELAFNYMLHRAARDGYDRVAWTSASTQEDRSSLGYHGPRKGYSRIYDEMFVKQANARGKKHGVSVYSAEMDGVSDHTLEITPELREDLLGGSPLYPKRFALDTSTEPLTETQQAEVNKIFATEGGVAPGSALRTFLPANVTNPEDANLDDYTWGRLGFARNGTSGGEFRVVVKEGVVSPRVFHGGSYAGGPIEPWAHARSGEGRMGGPLVQGPGMYFDESPGGARQYFKYVGEDKAKLWVGDIVADDFIPSPSDPLSSWPEGMVEKVRSAAAEAGIRVDEDGLPPYADGARMKNYRHGRWPVGQFVSELGAERALKLLVKHGIRGMYHHLKSAKPFHKEYSVFDPEMVKNLSQVEDVADYAAENSASNGFGKALLDTKQREVQENTTYSSWEDLLSGFLQRLTDFPDTVKSGEIVITNPSRDSVRAIWSNPDFQNPAVFSLDFVSDPRSNYYRGDSRSDYWSVADIRADGGYQYDMEAQEAGGYAPLRGPGVSARAVVVAERPDLAETRSPGEAKRFALNNSTENLTAEQQAAVDSIMGGTRISNRSLFETVMSAIPGDWDSLISKFRYYFVDKYDRLWKQGYLLKSQLGNPSQMMADTSAHAAGLMVERSSAFFAGTLNYGIMTFSTPTDPSQGGEFDGTSMVEKLDLQNTATGILTGFDPVTGQRNDPRNFSANLYSGSGGLIQIFQPIARPQKNLVREFFTYARAVRAYRLQIDPNGPKQTGNLTPETIQAGLKLAEIHPEIAVVFSNLQNWNEALVKYVVDTGLIPKKMGDEWVANRDYIPFYKDMEGPNSGPLFGAFDFEFDTESARHITNALTTGIPSKKIKGGQYEFMDPVEAISRNAMGLITAGLKNVARNRAIRDAKILGNATRVDSQGPNTYMVRVNGEVQHYTVSDPLLIDILVNVFEGRNIGTDALIRGLRPFAMALREGVTRSPDFIIRNLMRDSVQTWALGGQVKKPVISSILTYARNLRAGGLSQKVGESETYRTLSRYGAVGGFDMIGVDPKKLRRVFAGQLEGTSSLRKMWEALGEASQRSEAATRELVYEDIYANTKRQMLGRGYSEEESVRLAESQASFQAMEILNFGRRGASPIMSLLTASVPFFNARIQGFDRLYRAYVVGESPGASPSAAVSRGIMAQRALTLGAISFGLALINWDDEDWDNVKKEFREQNYMIPLPFKSAWGPEYPKFLSIPISFEVGVATKVIPEMITRVMLGASSRETYETLHRQLINTFTFNLIPQAFKPGIEVVTNKNLWLQRDIVPRHMLDVPKELQYFNNTSITARNIGTASAAIPFVPTVSPIQMEYLVRGYLGTLGMYGLSFVDEIVHQTPFGIAERPEGLWSDKPIVKHFIVNGLKGGLKQDAYEFIDNTKTAANAVREAAKVSPKKARSYRDKYRDELRVAEVAKNMGKALKEIRDYRKVVERSTTMDSQRKGEIMTALKVRERNLLSRVPDLRRRMGI